MKENKKGNTLFLAYIVIGVVIGFLLGKYITTERLNAEIEELKNMPISEDLDKYTMNEIVGELKQDYSYDDLAEPYGYSNALDYVYENYEKEEIMDNDYLWDYVYEELERRAAEQKQMNEDMDAYFNQ